MTTRDFFNELYKGCNDGFITITTLPERDTYWFGVANIDAAADKAQACGRLTNTYFGVGLRKKMLAHNMRGGVDDVMVLPALYADIDVKGPAHAQTELPESLERVMEFLAALPMRPSMVVWSGNGVHCYWLLAQPFVICTAQDRERISSVLCGWGRYVNVKARELGWKLDAVYDLARVLRVPGSVNHKCGNAELCRVLKSTGERFALEAFDAYCLEDAVCEKRTTMDKAPVGAADRILEKCAFVRHCRDNAAALPEPWWHVMVTNIALAKNGAQAVHKLSSAYPKYNKAETDEKIRRAVKEQKPHTCRYIREQLMFECPDGCKVKAPVVHCILSKEERVRMLVADELADAESVFSDEVLELMAYAKNNLPAEYAKFKLKLKSKVSIRDFENAIRHKAHEYSVSAEEDTQLELGGIELNGAVQPSGWEVSMNSGVRKIMCTKEGTIITTVCPSALVVSKRLENWDDETEKVELMFFRNGRWKRVLAPRSQVFNKTAIIKYADSGLPVSSDSAAELIKYLWDYENVNIGRIPFVKSISRIGWVGSEFFPYVTDLPPNPCTSPIVS